MGLGPVCHVDLLGASVVQERFLLVEAHCGATEGNFLIGILGFTWVGLHGPVQLALEHERHLAGVMG